ncbi:hypothetical protein JJC04_05165 [Flavobacterium covae]|nr:hypothetical protein [Flavobacterium covae]QYS92013.1 hypothetical protein JJC04_05165 [Flavobacterium covae]
MPHRYITLERRQGFVQKKERYYKTKTDNLKRRNKKAKGSPAEHNPRSKKEEKGVFRSISETIDEIWDWAETQGTAQRDKPHTIEIPEGKSPAVIGKTKVEKKEEKKGGCFCKQEENQFYWSDKLTCDQRKKVLEVCQELWGEKNKKEKASQLMSIMYIETNKTFSPSADNGIGFSGLIQFNDAAAKGVGTTRAELKKMTFIKQMDYVKAYFMKRKDELNTMTDMYLLVMKPSAVGKGNDPNYAVFDESISVPDGDGSKTNAAQRQININREPWVTKYGYSSNPKFLTEKGEKEKRKKWVYTRQKYESRPGFIGGKTTIKEIEQVLKDEGFYLGKNHIFKGKCIDEKEIISNNKERAPWVDVAFEEFEKYKGITEKESPLKERISEYFKLSGSPSLTYKDAWCATFVHWCFQHTEYKDTNEKGNVGAFDWAEEGNLRIKGNSTKDGWINGEKSEVFVGAVIVFSFSHVAIIVGENKTGEKYIYLGGNQGSKVTGGQKICLGSASKNSKDIFAIMKPKNYNPKENEKNYLFMTLKKKILIVHQDKKNKMNKIIKFLILLVTFQFLNCKNNNTNKDSEIQDSNISVNKIKMIEDILNKQLKKGAKQYLDEAGVELPKNSFDMNDLEACSNLESTLLESNKFKRLTEEEFSNKIKLIFNRTIDFKSDKKILYFNFFDICDRKLNLLPINNIDNKGVYVSKAHKLIFDFHYLPEIIDYKSLYPKLYQEEKNFKNHSKIKMEIIVV